MARKTTLVKLLDDLRAEARLSLNPSHNLQNRPVQVKMLQRVQDRLWEDFAWPHMRVERQVPIQAGQRYYAPPSDMRIDRIERIEFYTDGAWRLIAPGIDPENYTAWNSDLDQRSWPPRRWQIFEDETVEIWPIADTNATEATREGYLKFTGIRNLNQLVDDGDRADLDDRLIVLYAAAEMLAASGSKDAQLKLDQANSIYARLRGHLTPRKQFRMFGVGEPLAPRRIVISQYRRPVG
jgi:hypothetical protein